MAQRLGVGLLAFILSVLLVGCGMAQPPRGLAPGGEIVRRAIALQLEHKQTQLSKQLAATHPNLDIRHVKVAGFEPLYLGRLATYHLQGTYDLHIQLPDREIDQKANDFDIYLQRQREGKSWRWLNREATAAADAPRWSSYLVRELSAAGSE
ncbi:MAG: hypothetical protein HC910_07815 [Spirulinaceae cyanobacterium SM2_1_0]|nr:hypothetical protein [Spirulinaceae cyanobacterium SM2_1_0]